MIPGKKQFLKTLNTVNNHIRARGTEPFDADTRALKNNKVTESTVKAAEFKDVRNLKGEYPARGGAIAALKAGKEPAIDTGSLGRKRK